MFGLKYLFRSPQTLPETCQSLLPTLTCVATDTVGNGLSCPAKRWILLWQTFQEMSQGLLENSPFCHHEHNYRWHDFLWKISGFGRRKYGWKCPKVFYRTLGFVATNTAGIIPILSTQTWLEIPVKKKKSSKHLLLCVCSFVVEQPL